MAITNDLVAEELGGLPKNKMHCSNLGADALHEAIKNWRAGIKPEDATTTPVEKSCHPRPAEVVEVEIANLEDYKGNGVYTRVDDQSALAGQRVVVLDTGDRAADLAIALTDHTGRVVLMTTGKEPSVSSAVRSALRLSDVKLLTEAEPLELKGEGELERIRVHDLNEDEEYELHGRRAHRARVERAGLEDGEPWDDLRGSPLLQKFSA